MYPVGPNNAIECNTWIHASNLIRILQPSGPTCMHQRWSIHKYFTLKDRHITANRIHVSNVNAIVASNLPMLWEYLMWDTWSRQRASRRQLIWHRSCASPELWHVLGRSTSRSWLPTMGRTGSSTPGCTHSHKSNYNTVHSSPWTIYLQLYCQIRVIRTCIYGSCTATIVHGIQQEACNWKILLPRQPGVWAKDIGWTREESCQRSSEKWQPHT